MYIFIHVSIYVHVKLMYLAMYFDIVYIIHAHIYFVNVMRGCLRSTVCRPIS